eukprot:1348495-Amorphochlora_amoeboformis.AAC.2
MMSKVDTSWYNCRSGVKKHSDFAIRLTRSKRHRARLTTKRESMERVLPSKDASELSRRSDKRRGLDVDQTLAL